MKKILPMGTAIALTVLIGGQQAAAQTKTHTETIIEKTGPGPDTKEIIETVTGRVKEYEPGKEIEIEGPEGENYEFDLDENARIEGVIAVGQRVRVEYTKGDDGGERVVILAQEVAKSDRKKKS